MGDLARRSHAGKDIRSVTTRTTVRNVNVLAVAATVLAAAHLCVGLYVFAPRKPAYHHAKHTISELGEIGAPDERRVALGVFLPVGLFALVAAVALTGTAPAAAALAAAIAVGYIGAAMFPCDPGAPAVGSWRNTLHMAFGAVQYLGGGVALTALSESFGQPFEAAGFLVLGGALLVGYLRSSLMRGLVQRVVEGALFGGLLLAA